MGIAPQGHETAPQPDPALDKLPTQEPDPSSWEFVKARIQLIPPGDLATLPALLSVYPNYQDQIIRAAQAHMGNAEVDRALNARHIVGKAPTEDIRYLMDDSPPANAEQPAAAAAPEAAPAPSTTPEPVATPGVIPEAANAEQFRGKAPDPNDWKNVELLVDHAENERDGALLLKGHPKMRQEILDRLAINLGVDVAAKARALADAPAAAEADADAQKAPPAEAGTKPGDKPTSTEVAPEATPKEEKPAWVNQADAYNDKHWEHAVEFNMLTHDCCIFDGTLSPHLVAQWQQRNGLTADGKVGPHTVAAAKGIAEKASKHPEEAPLEEQLDDLGKA